MGWPPACSGLYSSLSFEGGQNTWDFPKVRGTLFGVLIIRILLSKVLLVF